MKKPSAAEVVRKWIASLVTPGVQTFVSPKSNNNLPNDIDREPDSAAPPGSAVPGGSGRDIARFEFNSPDSDRNLQPRTVGVPGDEVGHPTKFDYNMPTRRSMTGRMKRTRGSDRVESRKVYVQNKTEIKQRLKRWRKKNKYNIKKYNIKYHRNPYPFKKLSNDCEATEIKVAFKRQRKSRGAARAKAKAYYRKNKNKIKMRAKAWRNRNKSRLKITRRKYMQNPSAHRRIASDLSQEIVFSLGKDERPGLVVDVTDTGVVKFELDSQFEGELPFCLPVDVFTGLVVFDSLEDAQKFFAWIDLILEDESDEV
jgi:hypothetical protein